MITLRVTNSNDHYYDYIPGRRNTGSLPVPTARARRRRRVALTRLGALRLEPSTPELAGTTDPHATLTGNLADALSILQNNARVLAAPFLLYLLGFPASRTGRLAGDILVALLTAASAVPVGLELGRWHARLLPFLPQLPLEWAALAVAISAWLTARHNHAHPLQLALLAVLTLALLVAAAALETWATPHRQPRPADNRARLERSPGRPCTVGACRLPSRRILRRRRATRFKVARSLPLTALGSARPPGRRCPGYVNHQTPTRRDHMNSVQLVARLTAAPELNDRNGTQVGRLRLAVQRPRGKDGEDRGADFVDVTVFGRQAQTCAQYLEKGRKVAVEGHLHHSEWEADDGSRRQKLEVIARNVEFLDRKPSDDPQPEPAQTVA